MPARSSPGASPASPVLMLAGRAHYYEHGDAAVMRPALEALAGIGIEKLILTNAAGSLEPDMPPGSVMLITDHINFSGSNPLFGEPTDRRFVGLTEAYDARLARGLREGGRGDRHAAAQGRLHVVFRPVLRDAGRDPHGARHGRRRRSACRPCRRSSSPASSGCASPPARSSPTLPPA